MHTRTQTDFKAFLSNLLIRRRTVYENDRTLDFVVAISNVPLDWAGREMRYARINIFFRLCCTDDYVSESSIKRSSDSNDVCDRIIFLLTPFFAINPSNSAFVHDLMSGFGEMLFLFAAQSAEWSNSYAGPITKIHAE